MRRYNMRLSLAAFLAGLSFTAFAAPDYTATPNTDLAFRVNAKALRESALWQHLNKDANAATSDLSSKFFAATGISEDDVQGVTASLSLAGINPGAIENGPEAFFATLPAVVQIHLAKEITKDQVQKAITVANENNPTGKTIQFAEEQGLMRLTGGEDKTGGLFAGLSQDGKNFFLSPRAIDAKDAIARAATGKVESLSPALANLLDKNSQFSLAVILPESIRTQIKAALGGGDGSDMTAAMFAPFAGLSTITFGSKFNEADADFNLALDLGSPENANKANMTLGMFSMMLGQQMGPIGQKLKIATNGSLIKVGINLTQAELAELGQKAASSLPAGELDEDDDDNMDDGFSFGP